MGQVVGFGQNRQGKFGKKWAKVRKKLQEICKSVRFLSKNLQKCTLFEPLFKGVFGSLFIEKSAPDYPNQQRFFII